jgi:prophage antirepressor-like protein
MLAGGVVKFVLDRIDTIGFDAAVDELNAAVAKCNMHPSGVDARGRLRVLVEDNGHWFQAYWSTIFGTWAGCIQNAVEVPRLETVEIETDPVSQAVERCAAITGSVTVGDDAVVGFSFSFGSTTLRTAGTPEAPLFSAADICDGLGLDNVGHACSRLDDDEKTRITSSDVGGIPRTCVYVTEPGLFHLMEGSRKPEAEKFKRWVRHDVLPSIRKTGRYESPGTTKSLPPPTVDPLLLQLIANQNQALTQIAQGQNLLTTLVASMSTRRTARRAPASAAQVVIPQTDLGDSTGDEPKRKASREPHGDPRLAAVPAPGSVADNDLFSTLKNMIYLYGKATGAFDIAHNLVYDACDRTTDLGVDLKKHEHGTRIQVIGSQPKKIQRKILGLAYDVLVRPYVTRAS